MAVTSPRAPSPHGALLFRVHPAPDRAVVGPCEVLRVGERPEDADGSQRVHGGPDLGEGVFGAHCSTPDSGVVEEEQLVVVEFDPREQLLLSVPLDPLAIGLKWRPNK